MRHLTLKILVGCFMLMASQTTLALTCEVDISSINFGNVLPATGSRSDAQATANYRCRVNAFENVSRIRLCVNLGPGLAAPYNDFRSMALTGAGGDLMRYDIYSNANRRRVWGSNYHNINGAKPPDITIRVPFFTSLFGGNVSGSTPLYGRVFSDNNLSSGDYLSLFSADSVRIDYGTTRQLRNCNRPGTAQQTTTDFTVHARVPRVCKISATNMNFGTVLDLNSPVNATSTVQVQCIKGTDYNLLLNPGSGVGATVEQRRMTHSDGLLSVIYELYSDPARNNIWGQTVNVDTVPGTGSGNIQSYTVYGRLPVQPVPMTGNYRDTVVVTVRF